MTMMGLFTQPAPGVYGLTATTELLRADVPGSVRLNALMQGDQVFRSFAEIMHTMRTGRPAFEAVYGRPFYDYLGEDPEAAAVFHQSMADEQLRELLAAGLPAAPATVVDVGGGNGNLLARLLVEQPDLRAVLSELPEAVLAARSRLTEAGLAERVEFAGGSFFDGVPAGADAYLLARVLHNWNDENALRILARVRAAVPPHGRLVVLEELLPEQETPNRPGAGLVDLLMLVTQEGHDRTEAEYRELLVKAGFEIVAVRRADGSPTSGALEARPV